MPTWRNWLGRDLNSISKSEEFNQTEYFKKWNSFLENEELNEYIKENDIEFLKNSFDFEYDYDFDFFRDKANF